MSERPVVVLVDETGDVLGSVAKLDAHQPPGHLHLAFSVLLFRTDGQMLLQRRAASKYHFPGVWANACCSHPSPEDEIVASAEERVRDELGLVCRLDHVGSFIYRAGCDVSGLVEHELDHVFIGVTDAEPAPDPTEVEELCWVDPSRLLSSDSGLEPLAPWLLPALRLAQAQRSSVWPVGLGG